MPSPELPGTSEPLRVSILTQGQFLIVSIHTALDDTQMTRLQEDLIEQVGRQRSRGIIVDVSTLDVLDSFATRTLTQLAHVARLRGAETVVVGISPEVAIAMVQLSLQMSFVHTALDLEEGLQRLGELTGALDEAAFLGTRSRG
ncbi:MAG TPA: STAS domain-containing protein [Nocardioidaceae bacterium]|jgi:rsbT antagonist protein RsbS|nr:STAS domain-containing protein [Nocardioidaceae bacterium]